MKKIFLLLVLFTVSVFTGNAQDSSMKITSKKVFGGYVYKQNDKFLSGKQLVELMKNNTEALQLINSANTSKTWAMILGGAGGALVGFPIGTAIGGGDAKWELAGAGAALLLITIPISNSYNKKSKKAVDIYNSGFSSTAYKFNPSFDLNLKGNNIGLTMTF
jgi:hypothetical protein